MQLQNVTYRVLFLFSTLITLAGCTSTQHVRLNRWQPVDFDVQGVDRLAVLTFAGKGEPAERARRAVLEKLQASRFYTLVDEATVRGLGAGAEYLGEKARLQQAVADARRLGIDAVLAGRLSGKLDAGSSLLGGAVRVGDPTVAVRLSYDLIHVPTGRRLAQRSITRQYDGELAETDGGNSSAAQVADGLVRECVAELVADITACPESFEVALAKGSWGDEGQAEIGRGNDAAETGNWRVAIDHWHAALQANPESHAAMYNLGLAFEQAGDLDGAQMWYRKALAQKDRDAYQLAVDRVGRDAEPFRMAQWQVWRPRGPAFASQPAQLAPGTEGAGTPPNRPVDNRVHPPAGLPLAAPPARGQRY